MFLNRRRRNASDIILLPCSERMLHFHNLSSFKNSSARVRIELHPPVNEKKGHEPLSYRNKWDVFLRNSEINFKQIPLLGLFFLFKKKTAKSLHKTN